MTEETGHIERKATYSLTPKEALRNYIMQVVFKDVHWWNYPEIIQGMRESEHGWFWDYIEQGKVIAAYEMG